MVEMTAAMELSPLTHAMLEKEIVTGITNVCLVSNVEKITVLETVLSHQMIAVMIQILKVRLLTLALFAS